MTRTQSVDMTVEFYTLARYPWAAFARVFDMARGAPGVFKVRPTPDGIRFIWEYEA